MAHTRWHGGGRRAAREWMALVVLFAAWSVCPPPAQAQQRLYVEVIDRQTGAIVTDLQEMEVVVRENGVVRPLLDVRLANLPVKLAVVVDNSRASVRAFELVQDGLRSFIDRLPPNQEVSVLALAPEPRWIVRGALDREEIRAGVDLITVAGDSPARVLDGLVEASEWLTADPEPHRPVIVIVSADGGDPSTDQETRFASLVERLRRNGVTAHTLLMLTAVPGSLQRRMSVPEAIGRDLSNFTGGSFTSILLGSNPDQQLRDIAERIRTRNRELARQYLIRYDRPSGEEPGNVQVGILRLGARYSVTTDGKSGSAAGEARTR